MKLPNFQLARVPAAKITEYLLSEVHRDGKHKARFSIALVFRRISGRRWKHRCSSTHPTMKSSKLSRLPLAPDTSLMV